jgi:hypothetical protein
MDDDQTVRAFDRYCSLEREAWRSQEPILPSILSHLLGLLASPIVEDDFYSNQHRIGKPKVQPEAKEEWNFFQRRITRLAHFSMARVPPHVKSVPVRMGLFKSQGLERIWRSWILLRQETSSTRVKELRILRQAPGDTSGKGVGKG